MLILLMNTLMSRDVSLINVNCCDMILETMENDQQLIVTGDLITLEGEELPPKHHQAARLKALGFSQREISQKLGISESRLSIIAGSGLFKLTVRKLESELDEGVTKAQRIMAEAAPEAAQTLVDIMQDKELQRLRKEASMDILRGAGAVRGEEKPALTINISDSKLELIMQTLKEIK
jgi:transcriptional regulator with XRE-family HTH domain